MSRSRYKFGVDPNPYFITQTIVGWLPVFVQPPFVREIFKSWRFLQSDRDIRILAYVVMENHLHWIAVGPELGKRVGESKSYIARCIIDLMEGGLSNGLLHDLERLKLPSKTSQDFQLWQEGCHPQEIASEAMMWQKIEYTHNNPLRRGYIQDPTHWLYSSARNYAGLPAAIEITTQW